MCGLDRGHWGLRVCGVGGAQGGPGPWCGPAAGSLLPPPARLGGMCAHRAVVKLWSRISDAFALEQKAPSLPGPVGGRGPEMPWLSSHPSMLAATVGFGGEPSVCEGFCSEQENPGELICRRAASKVHSAQHVESPVLRRPCSGPGRPAGLRLHLPATRCRLPAAPATPDHLGPAANLRPHGPEAWLERVCPRGTSEAPRLGWPRGSLCPFPV